MALCLIDSCSLYKYIYALLQELAAIDKVYGAGAGRTAEAPLLIGSVKSNMGHAEGCSGLAGAGQHMLHFESAWFCIDVVL